LHTVLGAHVGFVEQSFMLLSFIELAQRTEILQRRIDIFRGK
jgi:hypothetical protein